MHKSIHLLFWCWALPPMWRTKHCVVALGVPYLLIAQPSHALDVVHKHPYLTAHYTAILLPHQAVYNYTIFHVLPIATPPQRPIDVCFPAKRPLSESTGHTPDTYIPLATGTHFIKSGLPVCPVFPYRAVYSSKTCTLRRFTQTEQFTQFMRFVLVYQKTGP